MTVVVVAAAVGTDFGLIAGLGNEVELDGHICWDVQKLA